jgi:hypothetical protein
MPVLQMVGDWPLRVEGIDDVMDHINSLAAAIFTTMIPETTTVMR